LQDVARHRANFEKRLHHVVSDIREMFAHRAAAADTPRPLRRRAAGRDHPGARIEQDALAGLE